MKSISNKILGFAGIGTIFIGLIYSYVGIITGILFIWGLTSLGLLLSLINAVIFIVGFLLIFSSITYENQTVNIDRNNEITGKVDTNDDYKSVSN
jgi:hypothetical protein